MTATVWVFEVVVNDRLPVRFRTAGELESFLQSELNRGIAAESIDIQIKEEIRRA